MSVTPKLIEGDIVLDASGNPVMLQGKEKLIQDLTHIILLPVGQNVFHPLYGCEVYMQIGQPMAKNATPMNIKNALIKTLNYFAKIQSIQSAYQTVTTTEALANIKSPELFQRTITEQYENIEGIEVQVEPGIITIKLHIMTAASEEVILPFRVYRVGVNNVVQSGYINYKYIKYNNGGKYNSGAIYK